MQLEFHKHRMGNACRCNFSLSEIIDNQWIVKYDFEPFSGLCLLSFFLFRKIHFLLSWFFNSTSKRGKRREAEHWPPLPGCCKPKNNKSDCLFLRQNGRSGFLPRLREKTFFTAAEGWGNSSQTRRGGRQENRVDVKYGRLDIRQLNPEVASPRQLKQVKVYCNGREIASSFRLHKQVEVVFEPQELHRGDELKVAIDRF